jgi:nitrogen fixation/metabolism regulation signal transduction histidine kinase
MSGRHQRRLRNLLIDRDFQLRFTLVGVLVSAGLCAGLGTVVILQMRDATAQFREQRLKATVLFGQQREATTKLMRDTRSAGLEDVKKLLKVATDMLEIQLNDKDPGVQEAARIARKELEKDDKARLDRRVKEDEKFNELRQQADQELVQQRQRDDDAAYQQRKHKEVVILVTIVVFGVVFVVIIFLFNIVITHKVAGPLFKIGRFFDELKDGKFSTPYPLRKGDQLVEFYERFRAMHGAVQARMVEDVKVLEAVLKDCETKGVTGEGVDQVRTALEAKKKSLAG